MGNAADPMIDEDNLELEEEVDGNNKGKVLKRILKPEREKLKREKLNELFSNLASVLELSEQNNSKACILREAVRFVNVLISEIQCLRKENAALLSESHYVTVERDELKDENSAIEAQIGRIQSEIEEQIPQSEPDLNINLPGCWQAETASYFAETTTPEFIAVDPTLPRPPALHPLYVIPVGSDLRALSALDSVSQPSSRVSKPHARYLTRADSWPLQLLGKQMEANS